MPAAHPCGHADCTCLAAPLTTPPAHVTIAAGTIAACTCGDRHPTDRPCDAAQARTRHAIGHADWNTRPGARWRRP